MADRHFDGELVVTGDVTAGGAPTSVSVHHGSVASTARPNIDGQVIWIGVVEPTNMADNDIWVDPDDIGSGGVSVSYPALTSIEKRDANHVHVRSSVADNIKAILGMQASYEVIDKPIVVEFGSGGLTHTAASAIVGLRAMEMMADGITYADPAAKGNLHGMVAGADGYNAGGQSSFILDVPGVHVIRLETVTVTNGTLTIYCEHYTGFAPIFMRGRYKNGPVDA